MEEGVSRKQPQDPCVWTGEDKSLKAELDGGGPCEVLTKTYVSQSRSCFPHTGANLSRGECGNMSGQARWLVPQSHQNSRSPQLSGSGRIGHDPGGGERHLRGIYSPPPQQSPLGAWSKDDTPRPRSGPPRTCHLMRGRGRNSGGVTGWSLLEHMGASRPWGGGREPAAPGGLPAAGRRAQAMGSQAVPGQGDHSLALGRLDMAVGSGRHRLHGGQ